MSVYKKLMDVRVAFNKLELKKSGHNKFAGYHYFELGDFLPAAQQIFADNGLCGVISFAADIATMRIVDVEDNSEIVITSPMAEASLKGCHPIQNLGAVETYTRRYLWSAALELVEHDAIDSSEPVKPEEKQSKPRLPVLTDEEAAREFEKWERTKADIAKLSEDGFPDASMVADAWGLLPSNVRSAIKSYAKSLEEKEQK